MKRLPVAIIAAFLLVLGLQAVRVTQAYASMGAASKVTPAQARNLYWDMTRFNRTASLKASGVVSSHFNAPRILSSTSNYLEKKIPDPVAINLANPGQFKLGEPVILSGVLNNLTTGTGIANKTVTFSTNGKYLGQTHANEAGAFKIKINKDLPAGTYLVTATFKGAHLLSPASSAISFEILPTIVHIQTVPATAGITFQMDGRQFVSAADGWASININKVGVYRLDVLLDQYYNPSEQVEFGRWAQESYQPFRDVEVPENDPIQVGLTIYHKVSFSFVDLNGFPVDTSRIEAINIRSIQGDVFTVKPGDTPWLPASRTARRSFGLESTDLLYSVNSVTIDGSNVVNSAQQRFFAQTDSAWTISLLLYTLRVTSQDGIFASPVGKSADIAYPDGQIKNFPLDANGMLEIHALARGIYHVSIVGVRGLGTSTPVALSRNQVVNLNIVTPLDLATLGSVLMMLAIGLIIYGRPWILHFLLRRKRLPAKKARWTSVHEN